MQDPQHARDEAPGATVELALSDVRSALSARDAGLRDHLPGIEPERRLTDWGRSERVEGVVDRTIYEFLYRHWFRVEVEGIDNIPAEGPALLVANHSGAFPSDGVMIAKAVREEHGRPRPVHLVTEQGLGRVPGVGMLFTKLGAVGAHPANVHRLLFDEKQLVLQFPEGPDGAHKPLKERYRLRTFDRSRFVSSAARAGAPVIPIAVVGAEEALPRFVRLGMLRRLMRFPLAPTVPLPAKFKIRFLEPVDSERRTEDPDRLAEDVRALIQENLLEMVAERRSVWLG
jgi:1-acyl-sn-glycerol-3-phosphate acyltransferase